MHIAGMSVPPVLAAPGGRVMARLRPIGRRGVLSWPRPAWSDPGGPLPVSPGSYRHSVLAALDPHAPRPPPFISGTIPKAHDRGGGQPRRPYHRGAGRARAHVSAAHRQRTIYG